LDALKLVLDAQRHLVEEHLAPGALLESIELAEA
jgi:hypothetical protein